MWNIRPRLRNGESLSSWLIRIAAAKGVRHHSLIEQLCPGLQFWTRDGDLIAPPDLIQALTEHTGVSLPRAQRTALRTYEGVLDETINGTSQSAMVVPLGVRHRIRRAYGQHFCPACLSEPDPYLRLVWRLRLFPCCTRHGLILYESCSTCESPYQPHRGGFTACSSCGTDLRRLPYLSAHPSTLELQHHNECVLEGACVMWPHLSGLHPLAFFALQLALFRAIASAKWGGRLRCGLSPWLGTVAATYHGGSSHLRDLTVASAHDIMLGIELLLRGWPAMFAGICQEAGSWSSWIVPEKGRSRAPFVLRQALDTYLRPGSAPHNV